MSKLKFGEIPYTHDRTKLITVPKAVLIDMGVNIEELVQTISDVTSKAKIKKTKKSELEDIVLELTEVIKKLVDLDIELDIAFDRFEKERILAELREDEWWFNVST